MNLIGTCSSLDYKSSSFFISCYDSTVKASPCNRTFILEGKQDVI